MRATGGWLKLSSVVAILLAMMLVPAASPARASGVIRFLGGKPILGQPSIVGDLKVDDTSGLVVVRNDLFPDTTNTAQASILFNYYGAGACTLTGASGQTACLNASGPNIRAGDTLPRDYCFAVSPFACAPPVSTQDCSQPGAGMCFWVIRGAGEAHQTAVQNGASAMVDGGADTFSAILDNGPDSNGNTLQVGFTHLSPTTNTFRLVADLGNDPGAGNRAGCFQLQTGTASEGASAMVGAGAGYFLEWQVSGLASSDTLTLTESQGCGGKGDVHLGGIFLIVGSALVPALPLPVADHVYGVTTTADSGSGSLRDALAQANAAPPGDMKEIVFHLSGSGTFTFAPSSSYTITSPNIIVNGFSQPGAAGNTNDPSAGLNGTYPIVVDGSGAGPNGVGFRVTASGVTLMGLDMVNWYLAIDVTGTNALDDWVAGSYFGIHNDGSAGGNTFSVALLQDSGGGSPSNATIGGADPRAANDFGFNNQTAIDDNAISGSIFQNDVVGLKQNGIDPAPNLIGIQDYESGSIVGAFQSSFRGGDVFSANTNYNVYVSGVHNGVFGYDVFGENASATGAPTGTPTSNPVDGFDSVGGVNNTFFNDVSGDNPGHGLVLQSDSGATLTSVKAGTDATGTLGQANGGNGIYFHSATNVNVQNSQASANGGTGVVVDDSSGTFFTYNINIESTNIGTTADGSSSTDSAGKPLGNGKGGVSFISVGDGTFIGNIVSGNTGPGFTYQGVVGKLGITVNNDKIGVAADGQSPDPNSGDGLDATIGSIQLGSLTGNLINVFSANRGWGANFSNVQVQIFRSNFGADSAGNPSVPNGLGSVFFGNNASGIFGFPFDTTRGNNAVGQIQIGKVASDVTEIDFTPGNTYVTSGLPPWIVNGITTSPPISSSPTSNQSTPWPNPQAISPGSVSGQTAPNSQVRLLKAQAVSGGQTRWGDYSWTATDTTGLWTATETIPAAYGDTFDVWTNAPLTGGGSGLDVSSFGQIFTIDVKVVKGIDGAGDPLNAGPLTLSSLLSSLTQPPSSLPFRPKGEAPQAATSGYGVGAGNIGFVASYSIGRFNLFVPGYSADSPLQPSQGFFAYSKVDGSWLPTGTDYTSGVPVGLNPGWNLVAIPYPTQGLTTDVIASQIAAAGGTVQEIAIYTNGAYQTWLTGQTRFLAPSDAAVWILLGPGAPITWTPH